MIGRRVRPWAALDLEAVECSHGARQGKGWCGVRPEIDPYMHVKGTTTAVLSGVKGG